MESSKENNGFDELLRDKLHHAELEPSTRVWKRIIRKDKGSNKGNLFIEIIVILLLSASLFYVEGQIVMSSTYSNRLFRSVRPDELPRIIRTFPATIRQPLYHVLKSKFSLAEILATITNLNFLKQDNSSNSLAQKNTEASSNNENSDLLSGNNKSRYAEVNRTYFKINPLVVSSNEIPSVLPYNNPKSVEFGKSSIKTIDPPIIKQQEIQKHTVYGGVNCAFQNRWIFNQNTYYQFGEQKLAYKLGFGYSYGLALGYEYLRKYGVQIGYVINSIQGEKYYDVLGGKKYYREIVLHYTKIPLTFKYKTNVSNGFYPIYLNYLLGLKYGMLTDANLIVNSVNTDIMERFQKSELSGIIGVESNIYLNKYVFFSLGISASLGTNINAHGYWTTGNYGKSHNFLLGLNSGLYYSLGK